MREPQPLNPSYWMETTPDADYKPLERDGSFDAVVIGGGITGLTTAYLLTTEGARVALIDSGHICAGTTGYTTAKITAQHGLIYSKIKKKHGMERARGYAAAQTEAIRLIRSIVDQEKIDCDLYTAPAYLYTEDEGRSKEIDDEGALTAEIGLPATVTDQTELPFPVANALRFDDQALFHPRRYCMALAEAIGKAGGVVAEHTRALEVEDDAMCTVRTDGGDLRAPAVVMATQTPFLMKGAFFARTEPHASYVIASRGRKVPDGMYISLETPTRSIRPHRGKDGDLLLIGGGGHPTGRKTDTEEEYLELESWARENFDGFHPEWRWSAEDFSSADDVPYIGSMGGSVFIATGFGKWGMTNGTIGARLIADQIGGRQSPWRELFDPTRIKAGRSVGTVVKQGLETVKSIVGDRVVVLDRAVKDLEPGEGAVVGLAGKRVAAFRDDDGAVRAVSATCTHLGCIVEFNDAERTWDCPCHGSRFDADGHVLTGPATKDLEPIEVESKR